MILARRLAVASVISTILLIGAGVIVRATGSGLGCPDWPTCHGGILPPGEKHPVIEVTHRVIAIAVGLLVIALAISCRRSFRNRPAIWVLAAVVVPAVGIQGILGAITVLWELPPVIVATHLLTAYLILGALVVVAIEIQHEIEGTPPEQALTGSRTGTAALVTLVILAGAVWLGGYLPESGASSACPDWPACRGWDFLPADRQELFHMLHRYVVIAFAASQLWLIAIIALARGTFRWSGLLLGGLLILSAVQVLLGALNVWYEFPNTLAVAHTVVGSIVWAAATAVATLTLRPAGGLAPRRRPGSSGTPPRISGTGRLP